jgi:diguanylate cyclase (GGDEF)-like protein
LTPTVSERQDKLQRHRLTMTLLSCANFSLQTVILALFAWAGQVPWSVPGWFLLAGPGHAALFALAVWSGWNLRFKDPGLLVPQLVASVVVLLGFVALAPTLWMLFVMAVLVAYNFAMMSFNSRQFMVTWLLVSAAVAAALVAGRAGLGGLGSSNLSLAVLWLFFFLTLRQLTLIGRQFSTLRTSLSEKNKQLSESLERIQQLASHDDLTGTLNRRSFMQQLADERARALRTGQPFCVALIDLDHFKSVNDRFGHLAGDEVLKEFCRLVTAAIRATDRLARFGGEEFVVLLTPVVGSDVAHVATERIRQAVEAHDWERIAPGLKVTMSAGVTSFDGKEGVEQLVGRADQALYAAKAGGRNRTVAA